MEAINLTIILIVSALILTAITIFLKQGHWVKYVLFFLALVSSLGAVHEAYEDKREFDRTMSRLEATLGLLKQSSSMLEHLVITGTALPIGFEKALVSAAEKIGEEEGYGWSRVFKPIGDSQSEDFAYLIFFGDPKTTKLGSEYTDYLAYRGFGQGIVFVSKSTIHKLALATLKGHEITELLRNNAFWVWNEINFSDPRFQESANGIMKHVYGIAMARVSPERKHLKEPEDIHVRFRLQFRERLDVAAMAGGCAYVLANAKPDDLKRLVGVDAIVRGGRLASYLLEQIEDHVSDSLQPLVCERHLLRPLSRGVWLPSS